jgi:hypothetical protein
MLQGAWCTLWGDPMIPNDIFDLAVSGPYLGTHEWHLTNCSLVPSTRTRRRAMAQLYVPAGAGCLRVTTRKARKPFGSDARKATSRAVELSSTVVLAKSPTSATRPRGTSRSYPAPTFTPTQHHQYRGYGGGNSSVRKPK